MESGREWDEGVPLALFAVRGVVQESLGFSPAELVFGHTEGPFGSFEGPANGREFTHTAKRVDLRESFSGTTARGLQYR